MAEAYIRMDSPGVVRFHGEDELSGVLAGCKASEIAKRWNCHEDLLQALKGLVEAVKDSGAMNNKDKYDALGATCLRAIAKAEGAR